MKLYKISQDVNINYETYDAAIVVASSEEEARFIHPLHEAVKAEYIDEAADWYDLDTWCAPEDVKVEYIGEAAEGLKKGVVLSSYIAG